MCYKKFYQNCYRYTGGWLPMNPRYQKVELGDFCTLRRGALVPLGNVTDLNLVEDLIATEDLTLDNANWKFNEGIRESLSHSDLRNIEGNFSQKRYRLDFEDTGSFHFHGKSPKASYLLNWNSCRDDITLKLAQGEYSFREVFVITAVATIKEWAFTLCDGPQGVIEIDFNSDVYNSFFMIGHSSSEVSTLENIACYEHSTDTPIYFFKGKKMILSDKKREDMLCEILRNRKNAHERYLSHWLTADLLNWPETNELNLTTTLEYFDWRDIVVSDLNLS